MDAGLSTTPSVTSIQDTTRSICHGLEGTGAYGGDDSRFFSRHPSEGRCRVGRFHFTPHPAGADESSSLIDPRYLAKFRRAVAEHGKKGADPLSQKAQDQRL
jgi:hypothetical protein